MILFANPIGRVSATPKLKFAFKTLQRVKTSHGPVFLMATTVLSVRYHAILRMHHRSDAELVILTDEVIAAMNANVFFPVITPALASVVTAKTALEDALATGTVAQQHEAREVLSNLLADLCNYVTGIANDPANITPGPIVIIQSAHMEYQKVTPRGKVTGLHVKAGAVQGSLLCETASIANGQGTHEFQFRIVSTPAVDWSAGAVGTHAKVILSGLPRAAFVEVRHRTITKDGASDWEVHEPVVVP